MPRVPTYDTPQVEQRALPGARQSSVASPSLFAAGAQDQIETGRGLMQAGTAINEMAIKIQERENADMLFRAETALKDDYLKFEQGVRSRKGQGAWGATTEAEKWFAEQEKKHTDALGNDVQRGLFKQSITRMRQSAMGSIANYEEGERRRSLEESAQASIVGSINQAAAAVLDDPTGAAMPGLKSDIVKRVQVMADLNGWAPERKTFEEAKHLTNLHKQVLQSLATKNPMQAKEYYEANKAEINGTERDGIERVLKEGTLREVAQTATDEIMGKRLGMSAAIAEARSKYKGDEEDEIVRRIKERYHEAESSLRMGQRYAADAAWKAITNGGGRDAIKPSTWNSLSGEEQKQISDYLNRKADNGGYAKRDDLGALDAVERAIEQGDITERAQLARYQPYLSPGTIKTLGNKIEKRSNVPAIEMRRVFEERKGAKVNVAKMGEKDRAEWMAFQDYILGNVKETKRPEDIDVWADRWFMKGYGKDDSVFTNDPDTFGEARTKGRKDFVISTPEAVRGNVDQSLNLLQRAGVEIPKNKDMARDEFYTKNVLDAERWFGARGLQATPELTAAYALLKQNGKPITPANLEYIVRQFK